MSFLHDIKIVFSLLISIFLFIFLIRFLGFKGMLGIIIGFVLMAYLVISGNPIFYMMVSNKQKNKVKMMKREFLK